MNLYVHNTGCFTGKGGNEIFFQRWDVHSPKAIIVIVHGLGEHSSRYNNLLQTLQGKKISVFSFDLRGHGKSEGRRGHVDNFFDYIYDLKLFINLIKEEFPGKPFFLFGHSVGGVIVLKYFFEYPSDANALILSAPCLIPVLSIAKWKLLVVDFLSKYVPSFLFSSGIKPDDLSHDNQTVDMYKNDSLVHKKVSARLYTDLIKISNGLLKEAEKINIPLLVIHGKVDKIADKRGSEHIYKSASSAMKNIVIFENLYHEIMNETEFERSKVLSTISKWIDKITAKLKEAGAPAKEKGSESKKPAASKKAPKKAVKKAAKKAPKKAVKKAAKKAPKKAVKKAAKKAPKKAVKKAAKKAPKKAVKKAAKKAPKKTVKKKK